MLDQHLRECTVLRININNSIKEPTSGYQNYSTNQRLILDGYLKVRKPFYAQVSSWVRSVLNHNNTRAILLRYEGVCMIFKPKWYQEQIFS